MAGLTITWRPGPEALAAAILAKVGETEARLEGLAQTHAASGEAAMKANAPWTDRTGNARAGLRGSAYGLAIVLESTVQPYGPYLEDGTSKMAARPIVQPTARQVAAEYTADAVAAVKDIWS